jgi:hypothetical protein
MSRMCFGHVHPYLSFLCPAPSVQFSWVSLFYFHKWCESGNFLSFAQCCVQHYRREHMTCEVSRRPGWEKSKVCHLAIWTSPCPPDPHCPCVMTTYQFYCQVVTRVRCQHHFQNAWHSVSIEEFNTRWLLLWSWHADVKKIKCTQNRAISRLG